MGAILRGKDGFTELGNPRVSPIRQSPPAVTGGLDSRGRFPCRHRGDGSVGRDRVLPASRVVRGPHPGVGRPYLPGSLALEAGWRFPRLPMRRSTWRSTVRPRARATPAVVNEKYGRYPWTPLGGSMVEQRFEAVDSRRMTAIWTTIRGTLDTLYAVPEGTVTDFPFLRSREDGRLCQVQGLLCVPLFWGRWAY